MKNESNNNTPENSRDKDKNLSDNEKKIRLNKYIATAGVCSRRDADALILKGNITVNDKVVNEMGTKVSPNDVVKYRGKILRPEKFVYILLNKPKDCVTTLSDPHAKHTVIDLINYSGEERIFPVGRLDKNTTGVLLLTNDGDLTEKLTHPSYNKSKIYHAHLDNPLSEKHFNHIINGFELEDGFIKADDLSYVDNEEKHRVGIEIHSGKNRIVRRIFDHCGYKVLKLDRVYFAGLTKKGLQRSHWRHLTKKEISMLKMGAYR